MGSRLLALAPLPLLLGAPLLAAGARSYDVSLRVDPAGGSIAATATVDVDLAAGERSVTLLLNRGLAVTSLTADRPLAGFAFRRGERGRLRYAAEAVPLEVRLAGPSAAASELRLTVSYEGVPAPDAWGVNLVTPAWVELGLYSGWFPLDPGMGSFSYRLRLDLPDGWSAAGTGGMARRDGAWNASSAAINDIVVVAAPDLQIRDAGGGVRVLGARVSAPRLDAVAAAASGILARLTALLGPSGGGALDVVLTARTTGGGYVRPGLAVLQDDGGDLAGGSWVRYLGHEISHLWWYRAPSTSWQDWINESFAEVTALVLVRDRLGDGAWRTLLDRYRAASDGLPPVRGLDRDDDKAYEVLYRKGPVILAGVEERIGRERFLRFLREVHVRRAADTAAVLGVLSDVAGRPAAAALDAALDR